MVFVVRHALFISGAPLSPSRASERASAQLSAQSVSSGRRPGFDDEYDRNDDERRKEKEIGGVYCAHHSTSQKQ